MLLKRNSSNKVVFQRFIKTVAYNIPVRLFSNSLKIKLLTFIQDPGPRVSSSDGLRSRHLDSGSSGEGGGRDPQHRLAGGAGLRHVLGIPVVIIVVAVHRIVTFDQVWQVL